MYWISRDNNLYSPYNVWTQRPTWDEDWGWVVRHKNGRRDYRQPVDSLIADVFKTMTKLDVRHGTLVRIRTVTVKVGPVLEEHKKASDTDG